MSTHWDQQTHLCTQLERQALVNGQIVQVRISTSQGTYFAGTELLVGPGRESIRAGNGTGCHKNVILMVVNGGKMRTKGE